MGRQVKKRKTTRPRKVVVHIPQKGGNKYKATKRGTGSSLECTECGKSFAQLSSLSRHKKTHTGQKTHVCEECGKSFYQKNNLIQHASVHINQKRFPCENCGKSFSQLSSLSRHKRVHLEGGDQAYMCFQCGKSFNQKANLDQHAALHKTPVEKLQCQQCLKKFAQLSSLSRHKRTCNPNVKHVCEQCGAAFSHQSNLCLHEAGLHGGGGGEHKCLECNQLFHSMSQLEEHIIRHAEDEEATKTEPMRQSANGTNAPKTYKREDYHPFSDIDSDDDDMLAINLDNDEDKPLSEEEEERSGTAQSFYSDTSDQPSEVLNIVEVKAYEKDYSDGCSDTEL